MGLKSHSRPDAVLWIPMYSCTVILESLYYRLWNTERDVQNYNVDKDVCGLSGAFRKQSFKEAKAWI